LNYRVQRCSKRFISYEGMNLYLTDVLKAREMICGKFIFDYREC